MPESELNEVIAGLRRADAAIGALAEKVVRLALQVKFALVKAAGVEAERCERAERGGIEDRGGGWVGPQNARSVRARSIRAP